MSAETVVIEDDDIDMEPVIILDEDDDKINMTGMKTVSPVETIDLDDDTPVANGVETQNEHERDKTKILSKKAEETFIINLKNNRMMDKIISLCLNMGQAVGMPRVINKTLLPLYRDINNRYKETIEFKKLLKKTYKSLVKDPDHKFLHIKTLCEELKSGGLRRKVPFVTLTTDLKKNAVHFNEREIESSGRVTEDKQQKHVKHISSRKNKDKRSKFIKYNNKKNQKKCGDAKKKAELDVDNASNTDNTITGSNPNLGEEKTDVIDLDNSDYESVITMNIDDGKNDIPVTQEKENSNKGDSNKNDDESKIIEETEHSNINDVTKKSKNELENSNNGHTTEVTETETEDSNKENKKLSNENTKSPEGLDYDLLIPQKIIEVVIENTNVSTASVNLKVAELEQQIACYKNNIAELEEAEVSTDCGFLSPYVQCAKLKKDIVLLYKQLCEIKGYSEDIVKRQEIRLYVAKGHPPGPAKKLEQFLNSTIDSTGTVAFPDFADVVKCVIDANISDELGWDRQRIFREAAGLFRQCGQALRKRRQKREYKDLLSLVKDKELTETDPAEADPVLLAKLEENKRIAKVKENHILERYVNIQEEVVDNGQVYNTVEFQSDHDSSGSDSDTQQHEQPTNISTAVHNEECSDACTIINNNLHVRPAQSTNNTTTVNNITITTTNSSYETRERSNNNNTVCSSNNIYLTPVNVTVNNQNYLGESSKNNNDFTYFYVLSPSNMVTTAKRIPEECLSNNVTSNNNVCIPSTDVSNIQTSNAMVNNCEMSLENNTVNKNPVDGPCTDSIQNESTCPTNDSAQNQEVSTDEIEPKCELDIKKEPDNIQNMLDALGDNFVCTVFDIEDPFLVIEISSDGFSDDD